MNSSAVLAAAHGGVTTAPDVSIGHVLLQMVVALAIVIGGIWGFGKIMRRSGRAKGSRRTGMLARGRAVEHGLTVLSRQPVGKGKSIAVVRAGDQCFLVGIADSGLTPLGELKDAGSAGQDAAADDEPAAGALSHLRSEVRNVPGGHGAALAPLDLGSIDLSALAGASGDGMIAGAAGRRSPSERGTGAASGQPAVRAWLDALREATVRR